MLEATIDRYLRKRFEILPQKTQPTKAAALQTTYSGILNKTHRKTLVLEFLSYRLIKYCNFHCTKIKALCSGSF